VYVSEIQIGNTAMSMSQRKRRGTGVAGDSIMVVDDSDGDSSVVFLDQGDGEEADIEFISVRSSPEVDAE
jgi:hypothetical protein